jgi:hypothetical protein
MDGVSSDLRNGCAAVVPVLPEAARNNEAANHEKQQSPGRKQARKTEEMSCIFENAH